jgi:hypothetical protein
MACMERLSFLITPEYRLLLIGAGFILLALLSVFFGVCPSRSGRSYRAKNQKSFWFDVSIYFLFGVFFWVKFLYQ